MFRSLLIIVILLIVIMRMLSIRSILNRSCIRILFVTPRIILIRIVPAAPCGSMTLGPTPYAVAVSPLPLLLLLLLGPDPNFIGILAFTF